MDKVILDKDHLLSVLGCRQSLSYRGQPDLMLVIPYKEFTQFVQYTTQCGIQFGYIALTDYKKFMKHDGWLSRAYLTEIAYSIQLEIYLSSISLFPKGSTRFIHQFSNQQQHVSVEEFGEQVEDISLLTAVNRAKKRLSGVIYDSRDRNLFEYSVMIDAIALSRSGFQKLNIREECLNGESG